MDRRSGLLVLAPVDQRYTLPVIAVAGKLVFSILPSFVVQAEGFEPPLPCEKDGLQPPAANRIGLACMEEAEGIQPPVAPFNAHAGFRDR